MRSRIVPRSWTVSWDVGGGPEEVCEVEHVRHRVRFTPTTLTGFNSGRPRIHVECLTCREVLHEATTGAASRARAHWDEVDEREKANPWSIVRAVWPGCFAEPWQDEQCDRGWERPTVWVVRASQFVRPVAREGLEPLAPGWDTWARTMPRPGPVVCQVALTPMVLTGPRWEADARVVHVDQLSSTAEQNSAAIVRLREMGARWWCRCGVDPYYELSPVLDVQTGKRYRADHRAVAGLAGLGLVWTRAPLRYPRDAP